MKQNPKKPPSHPTYKDMLVRWLEKWQRPENQEKLRKASAIASEISAAGLIGLKALDYINMNRLSYGDILKLFEKGKVEAYRLNLSSRQLQFLSKEDKSVHLALVPSSKLFLKDIHETVKEHNKKNPDSPIRMDYAHGIPTWTYAVLGGLVLLVYIADAYFYAKQQNLKQIQILQQNDDSKSNFTKSGFTLETERKATFADVAGAEEEKAELQEIIEYLKDPERFTKLGARVPKGVLLIGPPGTGKTLLARAVAGEAEVPFFSISGSEFVEMFVGVGAARVRDLFKNAKEKAPCIIFIDEIDALAKRRSGNNITGNEERETTLNQLLVELDGFDSDAGIILIGATNRGDVLDPALLRPGRFDRRVYVGYPDIDGRKAILTVHAKNKPLAPEVDLLEIAKSTSGFSGADLENLLNEAALLAAKRNKENIGTEELKESAVKVMMGPEKHSRKVTEKERRLTAFHEAGHAVTTYHLETQDPVEEVSIIPRGGAGGYTMSLPQEDRNYMSRNEMLDDLVVLLGGRVAEAVVIGDISTGASNDIERATSVARNMITRYGMNPELGPVNYSYEEGFGVNRSYSEQTAFTIDEEVKKLLEEAYERAEQLITEHRDELDRLAEYLLEHEKIDGEGFRNLMEQVPVSKTE